MQQSVSPALQEQNSITPEYKQYNEKSSLSYV